LYGGSAVEEFTPGATGWRWITLTTPATAVEGDEIAAYIGPTATAPNASNYITVSDGHIGQNGPTAGGPTDTVIEYSTMWGVRVAGSVAIRYSDGFVVGLPITSFTIGPQIDVNTTPDEVGAKFSLPFNVTINGITAKNEFPSAAVFTVILYDENDTILRTFSITSDYYISSHKQFSVLWEPISLSANSVYRLAFLPTTSTDLKITAFQYSDSALKYTLPGGEYFSYTYRTDGGAWTDDDTILPYVGLLVTDISLPASEVFILVGTSSIAPQSAEAYRKAQGNKVSPPSLIGHATGGKSGRPRGKSVNSFTMEDYSGHESVDGTVGYVQWRAFVGPYWKADTEDGYFDWTSLGLSTYTPTPTPTTTTTVVNSASTTVTLTDASAFPESGSAWIGPGNTAQTWAYFTWSGKSSNTLTGCVFESVTAEYTGDHAIGAIVKFWWELDSATTLLGLGEEIDENFLTVQARLQIAGIRAPIPALRARHLVLIQIRNEVANAWESWTNFFIGWIIEATYTGEMTKTQNWSIEVGDLASTLLSFLEAPGIKVGPDNLAAGGRVTASSTLNPSYKEANTGEFTGSSAVISPENTIDGSRTTLWISGGLVGENNPLTGNIISQVHITKYPGQSDGYRWVEVYFENEFDGAEKNLHVGPAGAVVFKDDFMLQDGPDEFIILAENPTLFALENPESKAATVYDLADFQWWEDDNNIQTIDLAGATGGTFTLHWDRTGAYVAETTGAIAYNATAQDIAVALGALTSVNEEDCFVTGPAGGPYVVEFVRNHRSAPGIQTMVLASSLTGGGTPTVTRTNNGGSTYYTGLDGREMFNHITPEDGVLFWTSLTGDNYLQAVVWGDLYTDWVLTVAPGTSGSSGNIWTGPSLPELQRGETIRYIGSPSSPIDSDDYYSVGKIATPGYVIKTDTKEWLYYDMPIMGLTLAEDIDDTVTLIPIAKEGEPTVDGLPASGTLQIGLEQISWASIDRGGGTVSGGARAQNGTSPVSHTAGDVIYFLNGSVATEAFPVDEITLRRPSGLPVLEDFIIRGSELVLARTPEEDNYDLDYTVYATVTGNTLGDYVLDLSSTSPRIRYLLIEITKMSDAPSRAKANEITVVVDPDVLNSSLYLSEGDIYDVGATILDNLGLPSAAIVDNTGNVVAKGFTTQEDIAWRVIKDLADYLSSRVICGRDGILYMSPDPILLTEALPTPVDTWERDDIANFEVLKSPNQALGSLELSWRLVDGTDDVVELELYPTPKMTGRKNSVGPNIAANATVAERIARRKFWYQRTPYTIVSQMANEAYNVRPGDVYSTNWSWLTGQPNTVRTYMVIRADHRISNFGWMTTVTLIQIGREDEL